MNQIKLNIVRHLLLFTLFVGHSFLFAQKNNFSFDHLGLREGLSQSYVNCVVQDKQGFMWFGTQDGLNKYDGYHFNVYKNYPKESNSISSNFIHDIKIDERGNLWIATDNGLNLFDPVAEKFTLYQLQGKGSELKQKFTALLVHNNILYAATANNGLYELNMKEKKSKLKAIPLQQNLQNSIVQSLFLDKEQTLWIATNNIGIIAYDVKDKDAKQSKRSRQWNLNSNCVFSIFEFDDTQLWFGTENGLNILNKKTGNVEVVQNDALKPNSLSNNVVKDIYRDYSGTIWLATFGGLNKYNNKPNNFARFQYSPENRKGINGNKVNCIYEDKTGTMWVGTESGINKFDRIQNKFKLFTPRINFNLTNATNNVWSIYDDVTSNTFYVGSDAGLTVFDRETGVSFTIEMPSTIKSALTAVTCIQRLSLNILLVGCERGLFEYNIVSHKIIPFKLNNKAKDYLREKFILCLTLDSKNNLWIGTKEGLFRIFLKDRSIEQYVNNSNSKLSISNNDIRAIYEDLNGSIWVGTNGGGLNRVDYIKETKGITDKIYFVKYLSNQDDENTLSNNNILSISQTNKGSLWLGTYGGGLNNLEITSGKVNRCTHFEGMQNSTIYSILKENTDVLWCSSNHGLIKLRLNDSTMTNYYENDGLQSNEFNSGAAFKSEKGELFFGGVEGFNAFFPNQILHDTIAPRVVITALKIFNQPVEANKSKVLKKSITYAEEIVLSYKQNFFSFDFSALHYSSPENNEFKYMMEGLDEDWNYVGTQNQANYTNLEPGEYEFKVLGSNSDGVWSKTAATIEIRITPPFWKTWWFRLLVIISVAAIIYFYNRQRLNRVVKQKRLLENQIRERTATVMKQKEEIEVQKSIIEEQKKKTESLVHSILPKETAEELINKGFSRPRNYSLCTVMFTDFQGFTKIAEKLRPQQLIDELDKYFSKFDEIVGKYNMERIKTIGDSYMCAGGIPIRNKSNPIESILAGLEIQRFMLDAFIEIEGKRYEWKLRLGINTGEIIAGVIGKTKFAFDIWGDTVNTASRTESSGEAGKVNITKATYEYVKDFFVCTYRGKIAAKNKGEIEMYFVDRIRPELSTDPEGMTPNELFNEKFSQLLLDKFSFKKSESRILKLLAEKLPEGLYYHGIHHTIDVTNSAEEIAREEGVEGEDLFLLKTAALFHDAGFVQEYVKNEKIGVTYAREVLPKYGYTERQIDIIDAIIMATEIPQNPKTHLEMIMCDADLDYLGREDFYEISESLKKELIAFGKIKTERQWDEMQIPFLEKHQYFTATNRHRRQPNKLKRIEEIKKKLSDESNYTA
jgi:ligand-binding sensor domain-containing protein/class 3 adenylate cyclase/predicted metal-dependent HD superfamily phosphohydrolase